MSALPKHIAIILDGNGRYAKKRGIPKAAGHKAGADNIETIGDECIRLGIPYLTVFAFSTENWKRSEEEVSYLMALMKRYLQKSKNDALRKGVRIRIIGDKSRLDPELQRLITEVEEETASKQNLNLTIAINYGGRDELVRAFKKLAKSCAEEGLSPDSITEESITDSLDTAGYPPLDLLIRTSGEERISNFLLWQLAYAELYFCPSLWPEFSPEDLQAALEAFSKRQRHFGGREKGE